MVMVRKMKTVMKMKLVAKTRASADIKEYEKY